MNSKKGFTLIELLTVIAVLAVILLIAAPIILNSLEKAKKNNFKNQALLYVDGLKKEALLDSMSDNPNIVLPNIGKSLSINISDIPMDGDTDLTGNIIITNTNDKYTYKLYITNGEYIICNKEYNKISNDDIKKGDTCGDSLLYPTITNKYSEQTYNYMYSITKELILNGVSASDTRDGDITSKITYTGSVDTTKVGDYEIIYKVTNSLGNEVTTKRTIHVKDTEAPNITNEIAKEEIDKGSTYDRYLEGIRVEDNYDKNIEATYICKNGILQKVECNTIPNKAGVYYIIYDAKDSSNNKYSETSNIEVKREIVVRDIDAPVITLNGESTVRIEVGSTFSEPGYVAIDDEDGDITDKVETSSNLNTRVVGTYTVQYIVIDSSNNRGIATRTIEVVDTTKPTITKVEGNTDNWTTSKTLTITASDNYRLHNEPYSYDDGVTWQAENTKVFTENKEVKIKVRDESENISEVSIVNIEKVDNTEPTISLSGVPDTIEFEDSYSITPSYTANGPSGGSAVCKIGETEVTNTSSLSVGTHTINCTVTTGANKTKSINKSITVNSPKLIMIPTYATSAVISNNIVSISGSGESHNIQLDKLGYTFDYSIGPSASISFCDNNDSCETIDTISSSNSSKSGNYTTTKVGNIKLTASGGIATVKNLKYKGVPVDIIGKINISIKNKCVFNQGNLTCDGGKVENNSVVSGNVYIIAPHGPKSTSYRIKINDGEWKSGFSLNSSGSCYAITNPGTYRIKVELGGFESDEYVFTIQ